MPLSEPCCAEVEIETASVTLHDILFQLCGFGGLQFGFVPIAQPH